MTPVAGDHPLLGVGKLANVTIASPGEVWSNKKAVGNIVPGAAIMPSGAGFKQIAGGDAPVKEQVAVALRQVEIPDVNSGPAALGPNEIVNQLIASGDWLRRYYTGALHLTLVAPAAAYAQGTIIGWDPAAARPAGKAAGTGAWAAAGAATIDATEIFEVFEHRKYGVTDEGILTVRFLRSNQ